LAGGSGRATTGRSVTTSGSSSMAIWWQCYKTFFLWHSEKGEQEKEKSNICREGNKSAP
jgi:hypothetical protein